MEARFWAPFPHPLTPPVTFSSMLPRFQGTHTQLGDVRGRDVILKSPTCSLLAFLPLPPMLEVIEAARNGSTRPTAKFLYWPSFILTPPLRMALNITRQCQPGSSPSCSLRHCHRRVCSPCRLPRISPLSVFSALIPA